MINKSVKNAFKPDRTNLPGIIRFLRPAGQALMMLSLVILTTCAPESIIPTIKEADITFNDKLRPDLRATTAQHPPRFMSDPRHDETVPATMLTHSTIPSHSGCKLRQAEVLWVAEDGFPILSMEAVAWNLVADVDGDTITVDAVGGCLVRKQDLVHPYTRGRPIVRPKPHGIEFPQDNPPLAVELTACRAGIAQANPDNPPHALSDNCSVTDLRTVSSEPTQSPPEMCMIGANLVNRGDVSYSLQVREVDFDDGKKLRALPKRINAPPFAVLPHIKTVATTRKLARVMRSGPRQENDTYRFFWIVPLKNDRWEENFDPNLRVGQVRAFTRRGGQRTELATAKLEIGTHFPGVEEIVEMDTCRPPDGVTTADQYDLTECIDDDVVTPTYYHTWLNQDEPCSNPIDDDRRLMWQFHFDPAQYPDGPPSPVYIEFELVNTGIGVSGGGLRAEPGAKDFGDNRPGSTSNYPSAIRIINDGVASMLVDTLFVQGTDAVNFNARPDRGALPMTLAPNRYMGVRVEVTPQQNGANLTASLVIEGRAGGQRQRIQAELSAKGVAADLRADPAGLYLSRFPDRPEARQRNVDYVVLENTGYIALTRGVISLQGPDAHYFSVLRSQPGGSGGHSPPTTQEQLMPGQTDTLTIAYHPWNAGAHTAELRIVSDAGDARVALTGYCQGQCESSAPKFPSPDDLQRDLPELTQALDPELPAAVLTGMPYGSTVTLAHLGLGEQGAGEMDFINLTCTDENLQALNAAGLAERSHHGKGRCRLTEKGRKAFRALKKSPRFFGLFSQADAIDDE